MIIIASHGNADFDSFASMVAASKLYPGSKILFTGSKERALERFLSNPYYSFNEITLKEVLEELPKKIILCDVSTPQRLGSELHNLLNNIKVKVILYDHHRVDPDDFPQATLYVESVGAVTTILVRKIREKRIPFSKMEATIFALGIYEDTGFLTYETTTPEDVRQVAYLLEQGADLSIVSRFLKNELGPEQVDLFNELIVNATTYEINRTNVVISTASRDSFFHDAAAVIQKQMDLENYNIYIAVIRMGEKIHLIGRSRKSNVDMGTIFKILGGGGHPPAAHANISGKTLVEVTENLLDLLQKEIPHGIQAQDIMTRKMLTLPSTTPIRTARKEMVKANVNSVPVFDDQIMVGMVSRQQVDKAISHKLKINISELMNSDFSMIRPEESIEKAEEIIMEGTQRAVIVGTSPGCVLGIITRMDLFRKLYLEKREAQPDLDRKKYRKFDVVQMMDKRFHSRVRKIIRAVSSVATARGERAYLVGGIVRDLILNYPNQDVDLVVIGDGIAFAKDLAEKLGGYSHPHTRFKTSVVVLPDGSRVDVVSSRSESYPYPGALPEVQEGNLRSDLYRRDFTINSLAIDLSQEKFGELVDYFGGMRDIRNKKIRILHGLSFIDDPTRILRGLRFASRLKFDISSDTKNKLQKALEKNMFRRLSGKRLRTEITALLDGPRILSTLELLESYGILENLNRKIKLDRFSRELLINIDITLSWFIITFPEEKINRTVLYLMVLLEKLRNDERSRFCSRLSISGQEKETLLNYKNHSKAAVYLFRRKSKPRISQIYNLFSVFSLETLLFIHAFAIDPALKKAISGFLLKYRYISTNLGGDQLKKMGLPEGPEFKSVLTKLKEAYLDGKIISKEEEIALATELIAHIKNKRMIKKS